MHKNDDAHFMKLAIQEARHASPEDTFPNPIVGCVIVEDEDVVARGYHAKAGSAHAEVNALSQLGRSPKEGARMYVTLEPCSTVGMTGACTSTIITSGLKKIIVGTIDPNPKHKGNGIHVLKDAGVEVLLGIMEAECRALNPEFNERMKLLDHGKK
jgi:riboflavin biosynthesis protein RibD